MKSKEIRSHFLNFFKEKSHQIVASSPMVLKDDPTLMFTNSGMAPFKEYFLGNKIPKNTRISDTQKCLRVSGKHNDLEEVGYDTYHHTMFEMLGNWSFGDYFKKEAITWAWELLTEVYGISEDMLYVTIFEGSTDKDNLPIDQEAFDLWKEIVPEDRILLGDKKDNFWEMGEQGPCGPCSEIHVDIRSAEEKAKVDTDNLTEISESIQKRIDKLTRRYREAERREKDRLAKAKAANAEATNKAKASDNNSTAKANIKIGKVEGGLSSTTDNRPYSALETTEEGRETSISFENNRGNLPWPVDRGNVYVHFGVENIPGTKLNRKSDGIEIALPKGSPVKSVANGTVIYVGDVNGDLSIFVKHGKYFTTYSHLSTASVKVMQEVRAGTVLGRSGVNLDGEGALLFSINNEKVVFFDPESWLKNRR